MSIFYRIEIQCFCRGVISIEHYDNSSAARGCLRIIHLIPSAALIAQINSCFLQTLILGLLICDFYKHKKKQHFFFER